MQVALAILPVIVLVALGYAARKYHIVAKPNWQGIEQLGFRLLFPAILITSIYRADLSIGSLGPYLLVLGMAFFVTGMIPILLPKPLGLSNPRLSSVFQASMRFSILLVLAVAATAVGPGAVSDLSVAIAFLIPVNNVSAITVLAIYPPESRLDLGPHDRVHVVRRIFVEIFRNPLVL